MKTVYLAGPIMGRTDSEANNWRRGVADALYDHGILGISPLRCEPLKDGRETYQMEYADPLFGTARAISSKNVYDVRTCDLTLAYLPKAKPGGRQSYGTMQELAMAYILGKPTIVVTDDLYVWEHPVINCTAGWMVSTLTQAEDIIIGLLSGYERGKNV